MTGVRQNPQVRLRNSLSNNHCMFGQNYIIIAPNDQRWAADFFQVRR